MEGSLLPPNILKELTLTMLQLIQTVIHYIPIHSGFIIMAKLLPKIWEAFHQLLNQQQYILNFKILKTDLLTLSC